MLLLKKLVVLFLFSLTVVLSQGCSRDTVETEQKIVEYDPSFKEVISRRDDLRKEIKEQKVLYLRKIEQVNAQIKLLQRNKGRLKREYLVGVEKVKLQGLPEKRQMERKLVEAQRMLRTKKMEVSNILDDINEITALVEKKEDLALTAEEMQTWNQRLSALIEKKEKNQREIDALKTEIEITKLKISVITI